MKTIKSKYFVLTAFVSLAISLLILSYFISIRDYSVFPDLQNFQYIPYTDNSIGGNSQINEYAISDSSIKLAFKLNDALASSYVGVSLSLKNGRTINLKHYNQLIIKTRGNGVTNLGMTFYLPNLVSTKDTVNNEIVMYTSIAISNELGIYSVPLSQFKVPFWWFEMNGLTSEYDIEPSLESVVCLNICNAFTPEIKNTKSIEIYSVVFNRNNRPLFWFLLAANLFILIVAYFMIVVIEKYKMRNNEVTISYKPIDVDDKVASKSDIIKFINSHFQNSELTLEMVSNQSGVSQRRITNHIQKHFGCNFKTYLNRLRINESKRLLNDTGLNIGEIAFKVGFNNQSHFNRVFKNELRTSPSEYREKTTRRIL